MSQELRMIVAAEIVNAGIWLTSADQNMLSQVELSRLSAFNHLADAIVIFAVTFPSGAEKHLPFTTLPFESVRLNLFVEPKIKSQCLE